MIRMKIRMARMNTMTEAKMMILLASANDDLKGSLTSFPSSISSWCSSHDSGRSSSSSSFASAAVSESQG